MTPKLDPTGCPRLLVSLEEATLGHPFDRKLLVCRRPAEGRELLRALAAAGVAWIGWEPVTIRAIALDAASLDLAAGELSLADEFDVLAAADEAIDAVVERGGAGVLAEGPGARDAIRAALATLRRAGIEPGELRAARREDARLGPLAEVLEAYQEALGRMRRDDDAGIAQRALDALVSGAATFPDARVYLVPGLPLRGVAGRLTRVLIDRGARVLETDPVVGLDAPAGIVWAAGAPASPLSAIHAAPPNPVAVPEVEMFAAATPADELREVLRRVVAEGAGWDCVEIVAPDPALYGGALESLGRRLKRLARRGFHPPSRKGSTCGARALGALSPRTSAGSATAFPRTSCGGCSTPAIWRRGRCPARRSRGGSGGCASGGDRRDTFPPSTPPSRRSRRRIRTTPRRVVWRAPGRS
jgi:hypothetical protein